jgi:hypothetical protein
MAVMPNLSYLDEGVDDLASVSHVTGWSAEKWNLVAI